MKLELRSATPSDFDAAQHIYGLETGDLVAAAAGIAWPEPNPTDSKNHAEEARRRAEWSCRQQKELVANDPSTRLVKVVDADASGEANIVAFGRWHRYVHGYEHVADLEVAGLRDRNDPATWPEGFNKPLYVGLLDPLFAARRDWMGKGHYWILTNIVTRAPLRKNGAGSMILRWGLEQAAREGVPAYLEAAAAAKGLYEKHGFREIGLQKLDCSQIGMPGVVVELARMRANPE